MNPLYIHECRKKIEREKGLKRVTLSNALSLQKEKADPPPPMKVELITGLISFFQIRSALIIAYGIQKSEIIIRYRYTVI